MGYEINFISERYGFLREGNRKKGGGLTLEGILPLKKKEN